MFQNKKRRSRKGNSKNKSTPAKKEETFQAEKENSKNFVGNNIEEMPPSEEMPPTPYNSEDVTSNVQQSHAERTKRILIWILLGVLASCVPLLLSMLRDFACGFNTLKVNYFRDLALIVVAVAANALSCALVAFRTLQKYWGSAFSSVSLVIGIALYYMFRPDEQLNNVALNIMIVVCVILLFINAIVGFVIEYAEPENDEHRT